MKKPSALAILLVAILLINAGTITFMAWNESNQPKTYDIKLVKNFENSTDSWLVDDVPLKKEVSVKYGEEIGKGDSVFVMLQMKENIKIKGNLSLYTEGTLKMPYDWSGTDKYEIRNYVKWNLGSDVISLTEWQEKSEDEKDNFTGWIFDDRNADGVVYWSQALAPQTETGKVLETIELINQPDDTLEYTVEVAMKLLLKQDFEEELEWDIPESIINNWIK